MIFIFFCHFFVFEKSDISHIAICCSCICASYALVFPSTELSKSFKRYKNMFLHVLHVLSYALLVCMKAAM